MQNDKLYISPIYSTLSDQELFEKIVPLYQIENPLSCNMLYEGANDSYKVKSEKINYLLRVYSQYWRALSDVQYEIDALNHLYQNGANVAYPIQKKDGDYITPIEAPEGTRYVIITTFAEGKEIRDGDSDDWALYGKQVAQIHNQSKNFTSEADRFKLDINILIEEPLNLVKPFLKHRLDDWKFLADYSGELTKIITDSNNKSLDYGFCHGDFHGGNAHKKNDQLTFFDFDCCGFGLRAYDLAVFKWCSRLNGKEDERWKPFYESYKQNRHFSDNDYLLIEPYISIRQIWLMGFHITHTASQGAFTDSYFDDAIKFLKEAKEKLNTTC